MTRLLAILILFIVATALSGCGIRGNLKTPPPIWGADKAEATKTAEADAETAADGDVSDLEEEDEEPGYGIHVADQP